MNATTKETEFTMVFDSDNPNWSEVPEYRMLFLRSVENNMNDVLRSRGHVLLNDIFDQLGEPRTSDGAIVGWLLDTPGGGHIDFGVFHDLNDIRAQANTVLKFNVDGVIYDKI